jgi:acetyl-CoA carboxylase carboxyl transferase subunit beta
MKEFFQRTPKYFTPAARNQERVPDNMWAKCPSCGELTYTKQLNDNLRVCKCGHHMRLSAREWLSLLDSDSFVEEDDRLAPVDVLEFVSPKDNYAQKLQEYQQRTGMYDGIIAGYGQIDSLPLQVAVAEFGFIGGSMGSIVGEKIARAAEQATERRIPLLTINTSGGARMHEGVVALLQMAKTNMALTRLAAAGMPHIALLTDPTYGGVTASFASVADIILAEPGANIGFAGRRVIEQTIRQKLPPHFQTAEFLLEHGMIDMVVPRAELRATLARVLRLYRRAAEQMELAVGGGRNAAVAGEAGLNGRQMRGR